MKVCPVMIWYIVHIVEWENLTVSCLIRNVGCILHQEKKTMSPGGGTLVSEQGVNAAFGLVWKGSAMYLDSYSHPLARWVE